MSNGIKENITDNTAKIISGIFHPLLMPAYGLLILFSAPTFLAFIPLEVKRILFFIILINNIFIPLAMLPFFRYRNVISSYKIETRNERIIPLLTTTILYCTTSFIVFRFQVPFFLKTFIYATSVLAIVISVITFWWKISIHSAGAGALAATVFLLSIKLQIQLTYYLVLVILAAGLVLSSRLRLRAHNPYQVWTGFATGFLVVALFILLI